MSTAQRLDLSGIYPPISTPFNQDESIAYDKLKSNLEIWDKIPFRGYVVQGSNGEYVYLSVEERVEMVKRVREIIPSDKLIIAGSGCESTSHTIEMTQKMATAGADAALVITPFYFKNGMNNEALYKHFTQVADKSPIPVIVYNVPPNTGLDMDPDLIIKLSTHPNIIGLKDSAGDISKIGNLVYKTKSNDFQILAGSASFLYPALSVGCVGGVCALANVLGSEVCQLYKLFMQSKHEEAQHLQHRLIAPNMAVTRQFGVPGLKQAMDWFGLYGGPTRSPLVPVTPQQMETLRKSFSDNKFL